MYIIKLEEKRNIVMKLLKCLKMNLLNDDEKEIVYNIVMNLKGKTEKQKTRFNMYYSLGPNSKEHNPISKIANFYDCSESAIRDSIRTISFALYRISEDNILLLKKMVGDKIGD